VVPNGNRFYAVALCGGKQYINVTDAMSEIRICVDILDINSTFGSSFANV
jgi:hypothetical protein